MAEALASSMAESLGLGAVEFRSAGTSANPGLPASHGAQAASERNGLDLRQHRSRLLSRELVAWADLVLTMGPAHLVRARELGGEGKSHLLGSFAVGSTSTESHHAVMDPFGGDDEIYEATFHTLKGFVRQTLQRLAEEEGKS